ncbi:MAG: NAD(P)/FAD-dependent oxidoreductase [Verrucomicrobiota bacterium]|nr:NAD(P)/FAD-dependent oxidoreductase [Verrucomicrobiota bacterium]
MPTLNLDKQVSSKDSSSLPHVVILGGGFAGLAAGKALAKYPVKITLIDKENHHLFQPLLYQVATAGLSAADIAQPLRHIFSSQSNLTTLMDEVVDFDLSASKVHLRSKSLSYDYMVIALGVTTGYFGNPAWAQFAPGLKTLDEATELRRRVLTAFERAELAKDSDETSLWLNFVVVGGGPTGVELAGAIAELAQHVMAKDFRHIDSTKAKVHLIEAGPRLLSAFPEGQSSYAHKRLTKMGVRVHLNEPVKSVSADEVTLTNSTICSGTILWAAGVEGNSVAKNLGQVPRDRAGRLEVNPDLKLPNFDNVFVAGDLAKMTDFKGKQVPCLAPAATQMGRHAAKQIARDLAGRQQKPFIYFDKGNMATIGRSSAVANYQKISINGYFAWVAWLGVHLVFLMGMRNRISVFLNWAWSYLAWRQGARIITKKLIGRSDGPSATSSN